jgi:uncharacterized protein
MQAAAPIAESERHQALDLLRGFAVLGILAMNIQLFAMPFASYANPTALGDPSGRDFLVWSVMHLFADQKFMTIFAMLFGAGVLLLTTRVGERGGRPAAIHYRRMTWLLVFGLLHAYLLWYGDILVLYAICGLVVYPARRLPPRTQFILGIVVLAVGMLLYLSTALTMQFWPPGAVQELSDDLWRPPADAIAREIAAFQGGWLTQQPVRAAYSFEVHIFEMWFWGIWRAGGLMLIGMALLRWNVLTGARAPGFYVKLAAAGIGCGVALTAIGLTRNIAAGWTLRDGFFLNSAWNYWGSLLTSLGYVGALVRLWQAGAARRLFNRLIAAGRMAFSCYIAETVICTTIFYGHGLGLFGTVDRLGQLLVIVAVWVVLLIAAPLWLAWFRYGPLEWLWRTLTYGRVEPIGRWNAAPAAGLEG